ncbi:hypothetical protein BQ8420_12740 [Nocardiopsis sp. JB363]|nr:hypothetical protein BQ8420_12740 [Nocardiopsis sp. JB363]
MCGWSRAKSGKRLSKEVNQREFDPDLYPSILDLTISTTAAGLTCAAHPARRTDRPGIDTEHAGTSAGP